MTGMRLINATKCAREKREEVVLRTEPVTVPVNRKERKGKVIYVH